MGLSKIVTSNDNRPPRIILYGQPGVGKTVWASHAPSPIFLPTEDGLCSCNPTPPHFPLCKTFNEVYENLQDLLTEEHNYRTVVIDTLSELEVMIWADICDRHGAKNIGDVGGGFGRGHSYALDYWSALRGILDRLNTEKGMIVILTAHEGTQEVRDPENITYDRIAPRIHKNAEALLTQWSDNVFQAKQKYRVKKNDEGFSQVRGIATPLGADGGDRIIRTIGSPSCIAKNRFNLPGELPLSFESFWRAINE